MPGLKDIDKIKAQALAAIASASTQDDLNNISIKYLGRKGVITSILKSLKDLPIEQRKSVGAAANKIKVEIMGNIQKKVGDRWEEPVDIAKYLKFVEFEDMYLPVLDLKYEMEAYRKLGRFEKAKMLEEYLKRSD